MVPVKGRRVLLPPRFDVIYIDNFKEIVCSRIAFRIVGERDVIAGDYLTVA